MGDLLMWKTPECDLDLSDLIDYKIVPYRGQLKEAYPAGESVEERYMRIYLGGQNDIKKIPVYLLQKEKRIYIAEKYFNCYWKDISAQLCVILRNTLSPEGKIVPFQKEMEKFVDLSGYENEYREAIIKKYRIELIGKQMGEEKRYLQGRRSSAMDDRKIMFVYSDADDLVHDKSCPLVAEIADEDFRASRVFPGNRECCRVCKRRMYVRRGCGDDFKHYEQYNRFFIRGRVKTEAIGILTGKYQASLYMETPDILAVECREDRWKLILDKENQVVLLHNNYKIVNEAERYIYGGYHRQRLAKTATMTMAIRYIEEYTWEKHRKSKKAKEESADTQQIHLVYPGQAEGKGRTDDGTQERISAEACIGIRSYIKELIGKFVDWFIY